MYVKLVEALCAEHGINLMKVGCLYILLNVPFENSAFTWRPHLRYHLSREESSVSCMGHWFLQSEGPSHRFILSKVTLLDKQGVLRI